MTRELAGRDLAGIGARQLELRTRTRGAGRRVQERDGVVEIVGRTRAGTRRIREGENRLLRVAEKLEGIGIDRDGFFAARSLKCVGLVGIRVDDAERMEWVRSLRSLRVIEDLDALHRLRDAVDRFVALDQLDEKLMLDGRSVGRCTNLIGDVGVEKNARLQRIENQSIAVEELSGLRLQMQNELTLRRARGARRLHGHARTVAAAEQGTPEAFRLERKSHAALSNRNLRGLTGRAKTQVPVGLLSRRDHHHRYFGFRPALSGCASAHGSRPRPGALRDQALPEVSKSAGEAGAVSSACAASAGAPMRSAIGARFRSEARCR